MVRVCCPAMDQAAVCVQGPRETLWTMTCSTIRSPTTQPKQLQGSISDATKKTSSPQLLLSPYQPLISRQTSHGVTAATQLHSPSHLAQGEVQLGWSRRPQLSNREDHWVDGIDLGNPAVLACRVPGDVPTISGRCPNYSNPMCGAKT